MGEPRCALADELEIKAAYTTLTHLEESALTIAGHTVWNKHNEIIDGKYVNDTKYRDRSEWVIKRDTHQAMITEDEAEILVKQREKQLKDKRRYRKSNYLLSGLVKCKCGANIEGNGGFYRCHVRCGNRTIKQETLENAVLESLFDEILITGYLEELQKEVIKTLKADANGKNYHLAALEKESKDIDKQINELVGLIPQLKHKRPLLEKLDLLEEERISVSAKLAAEKINSKPAIIDASPEVINAFILDYRKNLKEGEAHT